MTAISTFKSTAARARGFVALHGSLSAEQRAAMPDHRDLLRAGVVFAVAGMDAYFTDRFAESLVRFLKSRGPTADLTKLLAQAGLDTRAALEMLSMQRPYRRVRTLLEWHLSRKTTQKQDVIDKLFRVYGVPDLCANAQRHAKKKELLAVVDDAVLRRHSIVHSGDLNAHDKAQPIDDARASRYIQTIELFVTSAEYVIAKSLKI